MQKVQTPGPAAKPGSPAAKLKAALGQARAALGERRLDQAQAFARKARQLCKRLPQMDRAVTSLEIALHSQRGDYEGAARALLAAIRRHAGRRDDPDLFFFHNWMAILRQAQGDLPGAFLECAQRTAAGYEGTWGEAAARLQLTRFKDDWHRAYLFRMYAEQVTGSKREAALHAARKAREDYVAAGGYPDSIAVLDAFFAMHDRRWKDARAAVRRVDLEKNDDEEDLYLLFSAADAAGDKETAAKARRQIEKLPPSWAIWRTWLKNDTEGSPSARRFSPRYPTGRP